jgi:hypothetical protein
MADRCACGCTYGMNRHTCVHACGMNRHACVRACGVKQLWLGGKVDE